MHYLLIPVAAVAVWPLYVWVSKGSPARRLIRVLLGIVFGLTVLVVGCVGVVTYRAWPQDPGRFDDELYALVLYGGAFLAISLSMLLLGEIAVWVKTRLIGRGRGS